VYLAITWNKQHDYGHVSKQLPTVDHPAGNGAGVILKVKRGCTGYRPGLYSTKASIMENCEVV
jgi:hypothetical protein